MLAKENIKTIDGRLAGNINDIYSQIVNCRVIKPPYSQKLRNTSFFLDKRFGFMPLVCSGCAGATVTNNKGMFTDTIQLDGKTYFMWVDLIQKIMRIYKLEKDSCCIEQVGNTQCISANGYFKFIKTTFVKGKPRQLFDGCTDTESNTGIQINLNISGGVDAQFSDSTYMGCPSQKYSSNVKVGDYLFAYDLSQPVQQGITGFPGQVGVVTGKLAGATKLDIRLAWSGFAPGQQTGDSIKYKVFGEFGDVFAIDTCDGLKVWTDDTEPFLHAGLTNTQSSFIQNNNGNIVYVNQKGYISFGGIGTLQFFGVAGSELFVGGDVIATPTFQQYLLVFKKDSLLVYQLELQQDGSYIPKLTPTNINIGLYSKYAYATYFNSFYFLGSDKRLYALSISPTQFGVFDVKLDDMSMYVKGDLDLLSDGDQVYIQADNNDMKIFINGDYRGNGWVYKTKILIYEKDYKFWHTWTSCSNLISSERFGYWLGRGLYKNCGYLDGYNCQLEQGIPYSQIIEAYIGENEIANPNINMWTPKNITKGQIFIGRDTDMNEGKSFVELTQYSNCLQPVWRLSNPDNICYIKMIKDARAGKLVVPTADMMRLVEACNNYERPCKKSGDSVDILVKDDCLCPDKEPVLDDYCICIDDKKYFIAPMSKLTFDTYNTIFNNLYRFRLVANDGDRIVFGGFLLGYYENLWMDTDPFCEGIWACSKCGEGQCKCEAYPEYNDTSVDYCDCD